MNAGEQWHFVGNSSDRRGDFVDPSEIGETIRFRNKVPRAAAALNFKMKSRERTYFASGFFALFGKARSAHKRPVKRTRILAGKQSRIICMLHARGGWNSISSFTIYGRLERRLCTLQSRWSSRKLLAFDRSWHPASNCLNKIKLPSNYRKTEHWNL